MSVSINFDKKKNTKKNLKIWLDQIPHEPFYEHLALAGAESAGPSHAGGSVWPEELCYWR